MAQSAPDYPGEKDKNYNTGFIRGIAVAASFLINGHKRDEIAIDLLNETGIKYHDLIKADVDDYDISILLSRVKSEIE